MSGSVGPIPANPLGSIARSEAAGAPQQTEPKQAAAAEAPATQTEPTDDAGGVRSHLRNERELLGPQAFFPSTTLGRPHRARLFLDADAGMRAHQPIPNLVRDATAGNPASLLTGSPSLGGQAAVRVGIDSPHFGLDVTARGAAQASLQSDPALAALISGFVGLQPEIDALSGQFQSIQQDLHSAETQEAIATLRQVAGEISRGDFRNVGQMQSAISHVQGIYNRLSPMLGELSDRLGRIDQALQGINDGTFGITMDGGAQGMLSVGAHGRVSLPDAGPVTRAYVGVRGDVHMPQATPSSLGDAIPQPLSLPQLMARAQGNIQLQLAGTDQIKQTLAAAREFTEAFEAVKPYVKNPYSAAGNPAAAEAAIGNLEAKGNALQSAYSAMEQALSAEAEVNAEVHRATGPQVGLGLMAGFRLFESQRWSGLQVDLGARNLVGFGAGAIDSYSGHLNLISGESSFQLDGSRGANTFRRFFPVSLEGAISTQLPDAVPAGIRTGLMVHGTWQPGEKTGSVMAGLNQPLSRHFSLQAGYEHLFAPGRDADLLIGGLRLGNAGSGFSWGVMGGASLDGSAFRAQTSLQYTF